VVVMSTVCVRVVPVQLEQIAVLGADGVRNDQKMRDLPERAREQQQRGQSRERAQPEPGRVTTGVSASYVRTPHRPHA
jgi:hypothetical protein